MEDVLICLTASHQNASFDLLERLSIGAPGAADALVSDSNVLAGAVVLATCNRFEAYLDVPGDDAARAVEATITAVAAASHVDAGAVRDTVAVLDGAAVVHHLFAVSSGLESVVVGETEISGQVRRALESARAAGSTTSDLERLFQEAAHTSRGVKTQTRIGAAGRSLVRLALELASSRITDWTATRVLLVGTGRYAATTVATLRRHGVENITVFSPSGRAAAFAAKHELQSSTDLAAAIAVSDVVITCTTTEAPIIDAPVLDDGIRRIVIDLGMPRNVVAAVASLPEIDLLDLETISIHAPVHELNAESEARAIVEDAATRFGAATREQTATPALVTLRSHIFDLLDAEIERARRRGDSEQTERALRHLVGVLLHRPSVRARELGAEGRADEFAAGLEAVFGLTADDSAALDRPAPIVPIADVARRRTGADAADAG